MKYLWLLLTGIILTSCTTTELSQSDLKAPFINNRADAEKCYQKALKKKASLKGTVELKFLINNEGRAYKTIFRKKGSTIKSRRLNACLKRAVHKWQFPKGQEIEVIYPFHFENTTSQLSNESNTTDPAQDELQESLLLEAPADDEFPEQAP